MQNIARLAKPLTALLLLPAIMACAPMSHRQQNAAVGAGVGAVAGSILRAALTPRPLARMHTAKTIAPKTVTLSGSSTTRRGK